VKFSAPTKSKFSVKMAPQTNLQATNLKRLLTDKTNMENDIKAKDIEISGTDLNNQDAIAKLRKERAALVDYLCEIEEKISDLYNDPGEL
jgi:riboflavin synthase alpha subunit